MLKLDFCSIHQVVYKLLLSRCTVLVKTKHLIVIFTISISLVFILIKTKIFLQTQTFYEYDAGPYDIFLKLCSNMCSIIEKLVYILFNCVSTKVQICY